MHQADNGFVGFDRGTWQRMALHNMETLSDTDRTACRGGLFFGLAALLLACVGCWEEVHYDPSKFIEKPQPTEQSPAEPSEQPAAEAVTVADDETPAASPIVEEPTQAEQTETFEELFGEDQEAATPETQVDPLRPSRTALAAWRMSSRWSLAAAIQAKGLGEEAYRGPLEEATYAAELLHVELPPLPEEANGQALNAVVVDRLLQSGRTEIAEQLAEEYLPEYVSLSELAIKTHLLLLVYTPKSTELDSAIQAIRTAAEKSGLPSSLWSQLLDLLEARAPFAEVKQAVLDLHREVAAYLADAPP